MVRILIVDDEEKIRNIIKKYAINEGFDIFEASDGIGAINIVNNNNIDIIVMDIMMNPIDGYETSRQIKIIKDIPIILLSALGSEYDKIKGFEIGIDDYVVKPFSPKELMFRIHAILNRVNKDNDTYKINGLVINFKARTLKIDNTNIDLSYKEFELLSYLVRNAGRAINREELIEAVWGLDFYGDDRTLDTHIKLLRKHMLDYSKYITTIRGVGYRFETDN